MASKSLYLKYRSQDFENLIGQDFVKKTLISAIKNNLVAHAYLFTGPRGTGKTSSARLIAKALNCLDLQKDYDPCNQCEFCVAINQGNFIDLIEIDAASNRGIDEIRDLKEKIRFSPTRSKYKIYIIDEVHMLTKEAFNALLKTLEEPPEHSYFILATTEIHKIPETIISRCQRFDFLRVPGDIMVARLEKIAGLEKIKYEKEALEMIAKYSEGCVRDAVGLLDQMSLGEKITVDYVSKNLGLTGLSILEDLWNSIILASRKSLSGNGENGTPNEVEKGLQIINSLHKQGTDFKQFLEEFLEFLRERMLEVVQVQGEVSKILKIIEVFQKAKTNYDPAIPQLSSEIAVIECNIDQFEKLEKVELESLETKVPKLVTEVKEPTEVPKSKKVPESTPIDKNKKAEEIEPDKKNQPPKKVEIVNEVEIAEISEAPQNKEILECSLKDVEEIWPKLIKKIKTPTLRMSFKSGGPRQIIGRNLEVVFSSNFHQEKVNTSENLKELENLLLEEFQFSLKVEPVVDPSFKPKFLSSNQIRPEASEDSAFQNSAPATNQNFGQITNPNENSVPKAQKKPEDVDEVLDIFGGEVLD